MNERFTIVCEDTSRWLPGDVRGEYLTRFVHDNERKYRCPFSGKERSEIVFSGTGDECREWIRQRGMR